MSDTLWITGADGFTASYLRSHLAGLSHRPRLVGLGRSGRSAGWDEYHRVDLSDLDSLVPVAGDSPPSTIIHLAGLVPPATPGELMVAHAQLTLNLLTALHRAGRRGVRILNVGSAGEYMPPFSGPVPESHPIGGMSPYGQSKSAQTCLALTVGAQLGQEVVVLRPFNLVGPGMSTKLVLGWLARQYAEGAEELVVGNLDSARDFLDIREAVTTYLEVLQKGTPGLVYNLGRGEATTVRQLCSLLEQKSGRTLPIRVDPARTRPLDPAVVVADLTRVHSLLEWRPQIPLEITVGDVLTHILEGAQAP